MGSAPTAADVGQAWLDSLNDPRHQGAAGLEYQAARRGLDPDDLDSDATDID